VVPRNAGEEPSLHGAFESNINVCMSDDPDHCNLEIGSCPLRTALCRISKAVPVGTQPSDPPSFRLDSPSLTAQGAHRRWDSAGI